MKKPRPLKLFAPDTGCVVTSRPGTNPGYQGFCFSNRLGSEIVGYVPEIYHMFKHLSLRLRKASDAWLLFEGAFASLVHLGPRSY